MHNVNQSILSLSCCMCQLKCPCFLMLELNKHAFDNIYPNMLNLTLSILAGGGFSNLI